MNDKKEPDISGVGIFSVETAVTKALGQARVDKGQEAGSLEYQDSQTSGRQARARS